MRLARLASVKSYTLGSERSCSCTFQKVYLRSKMRVVQAFFSSLYTQIYIFNSSINIARISHYTMGRSMLRTHARKHVHLQVVEAVIFHRLHDAAPLPRRRSRIVE